MKLSEDFLEIYTPHHPSNNQKDDELFDTKSYDKFKPLLQLASHVCDTEIAFISFLNKTSQFSPYTLGIEPYETSLNNSIVRLSGKQGSFIQFPDISLQESSVNYFESSELKLKFYAAVPLIIKDEIVGVFSVADLKENSLSVKQTESLKIIAEQTVNLLELRKRNIQKNHSKKITDEYEILFNSSPDLICILNDKTEILSINKSSFHILGYEPEECIGLAISEFILQEDKKLVFEKATQSLTNKVKNFEVETRIRAKNNEIKWISWNAVTQNRTWFIIGREVTHNKEILRNLNYLSTVASKINNGVVISNAKSEVVWINNAFTKITGFSLADLNKKKLGDVIVGRETNVELVEKAREETKNKNSFNVEILAYRKDGKAIWLSIHNTIILDQDGEIESLIEIIIDITKRKESEQKLELLSLVASKTQNGVSICNQEGKVSWINESLENILGYSNEEIKGHRLGDIVKGPETDTELLEQVRRKAVELNPYSIELKVYKKDGSEVWLCIDNTPIRDEAKNIYNQIEIISDITERKEAEIQLLESKEEALQLSKAKEMFVSVMSHEIRTPLNAIIGLSNILYDEEKLESQSQSINLLKFSADNLLGLINDILDFSKIEMGKMELEYKKLSIRNLLKDIVDSFAFKLKDKDLTLSFSVEDEVPEFVRGDQTRLYQILVNLINNAVKFTPKGSITVLVETLSEEVKRLNVGFRVIDTGIGVPEDKLELIFEPFTQAEKNTTRKYGGSGLGLSITQKLVSLFGGDITISSTLGNGSEFSFNLIFNKFEENASIVPMDNLEISGKILVVDDNDINTLLAKKTLTKYGLEVVTTDSGPNAIELLKAKDFDVVLMDIHMPDMDGYEVTKLLRSKDEAYYKNLPIIALTASILADNLSEIKESGMNDFQLKPFKADELATKIQHYLKVKTNK